MVPTPGMGRLARLGVLSFCSWGAVFNAPATEPLEVASRVHITPDGPVVLYIARVELTDPQIEILVTEPIKKTDLDPEAILRTVPDWATESDAALAINANMFTRVISPTTLAANASRAAASSDGGPPLPSAGPPPHEIAPRLFADVLGLAISEGFVVSPVREFKGRPDPAIIFARSGTARVGRFGFDDLVGAWDAVAGIGASAASTDSTGLLVENGINTAHSARIDPLTRHPRTGVGVTRNGRILLIVVADGDQPGRSVGLTLPELADILIASGADDALNLDGGGSSSFVYRSPTDERLLNTPSDGTFRPIAMHLGVRLRDGIKHETAIEESEDTWTAAPPVPTVPAAR